MTHLVVTWERPHFLIDDKLFIPQIFDGTGPIPSGFNAVTISLDGRMQSDLNWKQADLLAQQVVDQGLLLFWDLNLGLFTELSLPLSDQSQFQALILSIDHFLQTLWQKYREHTFGLCLYRGKGQFASQFPWNDEQESHFRIWMETHQGSELHRDLYGRDVVSSYLNMLADKLPGALEGFILIDLEGVASPLEQALLLHRERFPRLHIGVKGALGPFLGLSWDDPVFCSGYIGSGSPMLVETPSCAYGICLFGADLVHAVHDEGMEQAIRWLTEKGHSFRMVYEESLTAEWDGLDFLFVSSKGLSAMGKRKLQGFCAAGGTVITLGDPIGLALERAWKL